MNLDKYIHLLLPAGRRVGNHVMLKYLKTEIIVAHHEMCHITLPHSEPCHVETIVPHPQYFKRISVSLLHK